ncbi:MAG: ShlB/FhaC/HecB family hemolysin secretion/activation protein [Nostoc sp. DedVER02]|uniref:ShlB/FhaC/HecB family hemolysin secretion/activation protein n=1 Tax=unclassified Nostoc TaxID=2593658 RepID=UPI002AD4D52A|nr:MULTISPECIES: ShlB/FhaC/HecB family hemolysin secretion/activation protein [unclassified Nostoc]MDZ7985031.1 ShlB/FhaC/HecB family hemolysin secretion/activation protein [Nostoc sp. DedVER02]MDZ8114081.1 ShlB/FhaC/HecB family hemolysin secretion/activation protein [Nostoc sp. DedVER01b]
MGFYFRFQQFFVILLSCISVTPLAVFAQSTPPPGITIPPDAPGKVEQTIPQPSPSPSTSPTPPARTVPILPSSQPENVPDTTFPSGESFFVKEIQVIGYSVLKDEIIKLKQPLENTNITFEQLLQLRSQITKLYVDNGYISSGAFIPNNQDIANGVVQIQVVEGELEGISISGLQRLQPAYVRSRIARLANKPLNQKRLEEALQLLQLDPAIERVNAELTAGSTPGNNILQVTITESPAFHAGVNFDNNQSPSVGSEQGSVFIAHDNLLGFGDRFNAEYAKSEGLNIYDISYSIPFNPLDGTIGVRYSNSASRIIENEFSDLHIRSEAETLSFNIRQPLIHKPNNEFALGLAFDLRQSQTFILNDLPFSFTEGPENGKSRVTVIRFSQDWLQRNANSVFAARSQFSFGIDAIDATVNDSGTDGRFFSWVGQLQWVQRLSPRILMLAKINTQLTPDSLLSLEKISIGGVDTVRGYRQNQLVADNGVVGGVEVRIPLTSNIQTLQLTPFFDIGTAWNNGGSNIDPQTIASLGLGLNWQPVNGLVLRADYGIPFMGTSDRGNSLQDNGFNFSIRYQPF